MKIEKTYKRAVNVLKPSRAWGNEVSAAYRLEVLAAIAAVDALIIRTGKTVRELYDASCAMRTENESPSARAINVELLHRVRKL